MPKGHVSSFMFLSVRLRFRGRQLRKKGLGVNRREKGKKREVVQGPCRKLWGQSTSTSSVASTG